MCSRLVQPEIALFVEIIFITILQVSQCSLRDLLLHCCVDDAPDVRQSAFALLGDLARVSPMCFHLHYTQADIDTDRIGFWSLYFVGQMLFERLKFIIIIIIIIIILKEVFFSSLPEHSVSWLIVF